MVAERTTHAPAAPETAIDPVCGMQVAVSDATPNLCVGNERVYFCCEGCRSTYAEEHAPRVSGLVLAAGGSSRLGQPKQLLPFGGATLLDHALGVARACAFDQLVCVLGGGADEVRATVDLARRRGRRQRGLRQRLLVVDRGRAAGDRRRRARAAARRPAGRGAGVGACAGGRARRRAAGGVPLRRRPRPPVRVRPLGLRASWPRCTATRASGSCWTAARSPTCACTGRSRPTSTLGRTTAG